MKIVSSRNVEFGVLLYMDFWERLDRLVIQRGLSRKKLAQLAGIGDSSLSVWKLRKTYPDADVAVRIARILGVTVESLVEGSPHFDADPVESTGARTYSIPNSRFDLQRIVETSLTLNETEASKVNDLLRIVLD